MLLHCNIFTRRNLTRKKALSRVPKGAEITPFKGLELVITHFLNAHRLEATILVYNVQVWRY